jgi:Amt family ammonium transporter
MGFRIPDEDEVTGIDLAQHAETAYDFGGIHTTHTPSAAVTGADEEEAARDEEAVVAR